VTFDAAEFSVFALRITSARQIRQIHSSAPSSLTLRVAAAPHSVRVPRDSLSDSLRLTEHAALADVEVSLDVVREFRMFSKVRCTP